MFELEGNGADLGRLNEAERLVLRLLAEGHTAKSIANELGSTPAAVNERLREARRKTGVGSSRELARLLKSQENRHEQLGVAERRACASSDPGEPAAVAGRSLRMRRITMVCVAVAALVAAGLAVQAPGGNDATDPLIGEPLQEFPQPSELHAKVRAEPRDPEWAPRMEAAITNRVSQIPLIGTNGNIHRVTCGSSLCEIAGTIIAPASQAEREDQDSQYSRSIRDLQVAPLPDDLAKLGLKHESGSFRGGKGSPDRAVYLIYYSRVR